MKKFFSYIFTFLAVFLLSAVATVSLSVSNDKYASSNENAEGQGSPLSFLTDILESFNNGKNIYVDAGIVVELEGDTYQLHINGGLDIKDSQNIKLNGTINVNINGLIKEIDVIYFDNIAYLTIDNIQVKVDSQFVMGLFGEMLGDVSSESMDFSGILEKLDITGLMNAINNMVPTQQGTDIIYPLKEEGVIDAEIVMSEDNELRELTLREFYLDGAKITLNASFNFNNEKIQSVSEDNYLDIGQIYETVMNLPNLDNKSLDIVAGFNVYGKTYKANIGLDFNRASNYYSLDVRLPEIIDEEINLDYINNNLYASIKNINIKLDESILGVIYNLISENLIGFNINKYIEVDKLQESLLSNLSLENIFDLIGKITINNNQICVVADLANLLGLSASGNIQIILDDYDIKELYLYGEYEGKVLDINVKVNSLNFVPEVSTFDNYLDVKQVVEKQLDLFNITSGNLLLNANVLSNDGNNVFDLNTEINANLDTNYYSCEALFGGIANGQFNVYYCGDVAYIKYNDIQICCSKAQAEALYSKYLKESFTEFLQDMILDVPNINKLDIQSFINEKNFESLLGLSSIFDNIVINKDFVQININENIIGEKPGFVVDILLVNGEINKLNLNNVKLGDFIINVNTEFDKNGFETKEILEEEYLDVLELIENTYNLKNIKWGSISTILEIINNGQMDKLDLSIDFNIEDLNNLYLNTSINSFGKYEIDANLAVINNKFYMRLFDAYASVNISTIESLIKSIDFPEFNVQSLFENYNSQQIDVMGLLLLVKDIQVNSNKIEIVLCIDEKYGDTHITINLENNNISSLNIQNLPIEDNLVNLELYLNRNKPSELVDEEAKYLNIETIASDVENILKNFGIDSTSILETLTVGNFEIKNFENNNIKIDDILDYIKSIKVSPELISINIPANLIGKEGNINASIYLNNNKIDYVTLTSEFGVSMDFAFNNNHKEKINIYELYKNVLVLKDLTYGRLNLNGNYSNSSDNYNFKITGDFDFSDLENIYVNALASITGALEADANIALINNDIFVRLFDSYLNISINDLKTIMESFGITLEEANIDTTGLDNLIATDNLTITNILKAIEKVEILSNTINIIIDASIIGLDTKIDITIKLADNDVVGLVIRDLTIDGHTLNVDLTIDKTRPEQVVENKSNYLDVMTLLKDVKNVASNFGVDLPENVNIGTEYSSINISEVLSDVLGIDLSASSILNFAKGVEFNSNHINVSIQANVLGREGKLEITIDLNDSTINNIGFKTQDGIDVSFAFGDDQKDVNIYTLYNKILALQNLRYGNISLEGKVDNKNSFLANVDFDFSDMANIYFNIDADVLGSIELDLSLAMINGNIFANIFDVFVAVNIEDIKELFEHGDLNFEKSSFDFELPEELNNLKIEDILKSIEKFNVSETEINAIIDATVFGFDSKLDLSIILENNDIVGLIVRDLNIDGHEIDLQLELDKNMPDKKVENSQKYLDIKVLYNDIFDTVKNFGIEDISFDKLDSVDEDNVISIVKSLLGIELNINDIIDYIKTVQITSSKIILVIDENIIQREGKLNLEIGLNESKLDYIALSDENNLNISFATNDKHEDMINVYTLYENILSLQNLRYGNVSATGSYAYNTDVYNFTLDANLDFSDLENIYVNAFASITGALEADANIALINNDIFVRLFDTYLNISINDLKTIMESFGITLEEANIDTTALENLIATDSLTITNILKAIEKVEILSNTINIIVDASIIGLDTKIDVTIKLADNDIVGLVIRDLTIDGHTLNVDLTIDKTRPEQVVENNSNYLDVMTLLKDVKNVVSNFGYELPETIEVENSSNIEVETIFEEILGINITAEEIVNYMKRVEINTNTICFNLQEKIIERTGELGIVVGLENSELDYISLIDDSGLNISFAFNDNHDMINIYTLYDNILALKDLRYGSVFASGSYKYETDIYNFALNGEVNAEDFNNLYINADIDIWGALELDATVAIVNNTIFARVFDILVTATRSDIEFVLDMFGVNIGNEEIDFSSVTDSIDTSNLTVENILGAIEKVEVLKNAINIKADASVIGLETTLDITIKLNNNDIVGLEIRDLIIDGHTINLDLTLDKSKPEQTVDEQENYLNASSLVESVVEFVEQFGVEIPETIEIDKTSDLDVEKAIKEFIGIDLTINDITEYLGGITINSSLIAIELQADVLNREGKLYINLFLDESKVDYVNIKDENGLDITLAFNDNHESLISIYELYENIISLVDLREGYIDASASVYNNTETVMGFNIDGSINVSDGNNYMSAFVKYSSKDTELSLNLSNLNKTFYIDYGEAHFKLTIQSLLELIGITVEGKQNNEVEIIDLINYLISQIDISSIASGQISINEVLDIVQGLKTANISDNTIDIVLSGQSIGQDKDIKVIITLKNNDISKITLSGLKITESNYIDVNLEFERTSTKPEIIDGEYFDAHTAYNSILDLFATNDITLIASGSVYNYNDVDYTKEFGFDVDARKNVVNQNIGAYILANIYGADYGSRDHKFQLNFTNNELYINYNELKGHLAKTAITNTVLSIVKLLGIESGMIETLLGSVEDLFEGVGLETIFEELSGVDLGAEIQIDESILDIIANISLSTDGDTLGVTMDGSLFGITGDVNFKLITESGKIKTIDFNKLNLGGKYVDVTINVAPSVTEMPTLTETEATAYWDFNSLEELANALYLTADGTETYKLVGNLNLFLGNDIEAADVPTELLINRSQNDKITVYGKLEIPTGSMAFKEYKGLYTIKSRVTYIYFDGEYLYMHRIDKTSEWGKEVTYHFYGKITFDYFGANIYDSLDFMLGFSTLVSMFKSQFSKAGSTDIPPYIENIFNAYGYTPGYTAIDNEFDVTLSGEALIQNDMIGDIALNIRENKQTGLISGIFAQMTVASIINVKADFSLEPVKTSTDFNNNVGSNIAVTNSKYQNNVLNWGF